MILTATGQLESRTGNSGPYIDLFNANYNPRDGMGLPDMVGTLASAKRLAKMLAKRTGAQLTSLGAPFGSTCPIKITNVTLAQYDNILGVQFISSLPDVHYWQVKYNITRLDLGQTYAFQEVCTDVVDRETLPNYSEDRNFDGSIGGTNLIVEICANPGMDVTGNLRWGNKAVTA
jgi:hypothetical protein